MKEKTYIFIIRIADIILIPFVVIAWVYFKLIRLHGINMFLSRMPLTKKILLRIWIFPISTHYYDPLFNHSETNFNNERNLAWIDFSIKWQLELLNSFNYQEELKLFPLEKTNKLEFFYNNWSYPPGDSEFLYSIIRNKKPNKIIEIGSWNSTLMAINAINKNKEENKTYNCKHICVEPYEMSWLEKTWVQVIRKKLEYLDRNIFKELKENDILFIDSSHIIRPGWDVLTEYLEILPILNKWVIVHIHDIFTPYEYPKQWLKEWVSFWNEQYLLEAFLTNNSSFKIIWMMNYLNRIEKDLLESKFPILKSKPQSPWSLWLEKIV